MSAFAAKRKARKITVQDDDDDNPSSTTLNPPPETQEPALQATFKTSRNKPFKQSSLRKSINASEDNPHGSRNPAIADSRDESMEDDPDGGAPLRIRPTLGKPASTKSKKRQSTSSRLSFGPSEIGGDDDNSMVLGGEEISTPSKKSGLAITAAEKRAYKKSISKNLPLNRLPMRSMDNDDGRPQYSKEYLSELQSSTPNTPQNLSKLQHATDNDEAMSLDPSELEGAMVVDTEESHYGPLAKTTTSVLTEAEIREKKTRRARIAKQQGGKDTDDFISLDDDDRENGDSYLTVLSRQNNKSKSDTRLVAEDEDLGEGFDDFVEDGGLSLGRKAEREARRRQRAEMASLITAAEGGGSDGESDDSEAERRAAYEATQTRAGMDGLAEEREQQRRRLGATTVQVPPKITPLPDLSVVIAEFKAQVRRREEELARMRAKIQELRAEKDSVLKREPEVQRLLNEAGERYRALMMPSGGSGGGDAEGAGAGDGVAAARSLLDQTRLGEGGSASDGTPVGQRGLESLGTTPVRQAPQVEL